MSEYLVGSILIPEITPSGTFPLVSDYPHGRAHTPEIVVHQFGSANAKIEQRFYLGNGAKRFTVRRAWLSEAERIDLRDFWEDNYGPYGAFTYNAPSDDGASTTAYTCHFANEPLSWEQVVDAACSAGITLIEIPTTSPTYTLSSTETRFPGTSLKAALLSQVQQVIPLIKIVPREVGYGTIYVSDRRCTLGGHLYHARLLQFDGIQQSMGNESDDASFTFGNADRVMRDLANDVDLFRASIEFSLFHITAGTTAGIKLDLWKGEIRDWSLDAGPEFKIIASDGLYELNLPYPTRRISRTCWKQFDDGNGCPYPNTRDLTHFPTASLTTCDKGYDSANGCLAHEMELYFGGVIATPQGVNVKDNSTGHWGFGRSAFTATSQVAESVYDQVVQEIYTDSDMPVNVKIVAGRDEGDFYDALGIVGEGPLGAFSDDFLKQTLDNQSPHGPAPLGLRKCLGADPAGATEFFSLGQSGDQTNGDWRKVFSGASTYLDNFAAGLAFIEIRRSDEKGLQLTRIGEHAMQALVRQGLKGWVWTDSGDHETFTRSSSKQVLTNPFWIVVNMLIRARGLQFESAATQAQFFDVKALADSTTVGGKPVGAALIADLVVDKIIGTGTETQFKFRGVLQEEKPLRDWIQEILTNCLGYYTFAFGKLKPGIRVNSSTVEAFSAGNILFQSLQLAPAKPSFNHVTGNFADEEFEFVGNTVTVYDIDHAKLIGGATSPLFVKAQLNLSGCSSKSQAARLISTRLREELGGINATEWSAARIVRFRTTILALNVEPGMVCSMTHDDMPNGSGEFRVTNWKLNSDFSVDIEGRATTDSMYDLDVGPKPADVTADPVPAEVALTRLPVQPWMGYLEPPASGDPLYSTTERTFSLLQYYAQMADGTSLAQLEVRGVAPVNRFLPGDGPRVGTVSQAGTGGTIAATRTVTLVLFAKDAEGFMWRPSQAYTLITSATATNKITLSGITWPTGATGYRIFASDDFNRLTLQSEGGTTPSSTDLTALPNMRTYGVPSQMISRLRAKVKRIVHSGVFGAAATGVGTGTLTVVGATWGVNDWAGRVCSVITDKTDGRASIWDFTVVSNTADTLTVTPDPLAGGVEVEDTIIMRTLATAFSARTIGDAFFENYFYPTGMIVNGEAGYAVRIIYGTGKGQARRIISNTSTVYTVDRDWDITPDGSSMFVVEEQNWAYFAESDAITNADPNAEVAIQIPVDNYVLLTMLVQVFMVDHDGVEGAEPYAPWREIFVFGNPGTFTRDWQARFIDGADPLVVGADLMENHYRVTEDALLRVDLEEWTMTAKKIPTGGAVTVDILRSSDDGTTWASLFASGPTLATSEKKTQGLTFAISTLQRDELLRYDEVATDGVAGGLEFTLKGKKVMKAS